MNRLKIKNLKWTHEPEQLVGLLRWNMIGLLEKLEHLKEHLGVVIPVPMFTVTSALTITWLDDISGVFFCLCLWLCKPPQKNNSGCIQSFA